MSSAIKVIPLKVFYYPAPCRAALRTEPVRDVRRAFTYFGMVVIAVRPAAVIAEPMTLPFDPAVVVTTSVALPETDEVIFVVFDGAGELGEPVPVGGTLGNVTVTTAAEEVALMPRPFKIVSALMAAASAVAIVVVVSAPCTV